jgi:hypothetical protein
MNTVLGWHEYQIRGPVDTMRYRVSLDGRVSQFWSEHQVPGLARKGWNTTRSATVAMNSRRALRERATA